VATSNRVCKSLRVCNNNEYVVSEEVMTTIIHEWELNQAKEAYELFDKQSDGKGVIYPS
jgi:hypothetical protein